MKTVAIIGGGFCGTLTAVNLARLSTGPLRVILVMFLTLRAIGWAGTIYAISHNGLLPLPHFKGSDYPHFPPDDVTTLGLRALAALKGTLWETTAVPELRAQTHQVAHALLAVDQLHQADWMQETPANLVEYYI